jgi:hypothetical protein
MLTGLRICVAAAACGVFGASALAQSAQDQFYERSFIAALNERCGLFDARSTSALHAARLQVRGALIRAEVGEAVLDEALAVSDRAAMALDCEDEETLDLAERFRDAFSGYLILRTMDFPGEIRGWSTDRGPLAYGQGWVGWQDAEPLRAGVAAFSDGPALAVLAPQDAGRLTGARLVLRDETVEPGLFDPTIGGLLPPRPGAEWVRYAPPDHANRQYWAADRLGATDSEALGGPGFRFGEDAAIALAAADPRDTARIDFIGPLGEPTAQIWIEVGDFAAALAFLRAAMPDPSAGG